jgi:hypothetical protein
MGVDHGPGDAAPAAGRVACRTRRPRRGARSRSSARMTSRRPPVRLDGQPHAVWHGCEPAFTVIPPLRGHWCGRRDPRCGRPCLGCRLRKQAARRPDSAAGGGVVPGRRRFHYLVVRPARWNRRDPDRCTAYGVASPCETPAVTAAGLAMAAACYRLPGLGGGIVGHRRHIGQLMLGLTPAVTAATPVLLVLILLSALAQDIQRARTAGTRGRPLNDPRCRPAVCARDAGPALTPGERGRRPRCGGGRRGLMARGSRKVRRTCPSRRR